MISPDEIGAQPTVRLDGQTAIVTGAARGIGLNIARMLANAGASVLIADINQASGEKAVADLSERGIDVRFLLVDLAARNGPQSLIDGCVSEFGSLDILINNARSGGRAELLTETPESWDIAMSVTLKATFFASQAAIKYWSKSENGNGRIVNLASVSGSLVTHEAPVYHATKAGVAHITRYLAATAGEYGVRVNGVAPGLIVQDEHVQRFARDDNELYRGAANSLHPVGYVGSSDDVAGAVLFLVSDLSRFVSGQILGIDGASSVVEQWNVLWPAAQKSE